MFANQKFELIAMDAQIYHLITRLAKGTFVSTQSIECENFPLPLLDS